MLAGVSGNTIGQWNRRGYIRASQQRTHYPHEYAYQDVGEAMIVHDLLEHGVPRDEIRASISVLRDDFSYDWPLSAVDLLITDYGSPEGVRGLVVRDGGVPYDVTQHKYAWQSVLDPENVSKVALELTRGGWAARELPDLKHIEVNPYRLSGRPAIRGTRVFAIDAARMAMAGEEDELIEGYGLVVAQISDAVRWYERIVEYQYAA